ncbi:hypothetical protein Lal_00026454 [Lupinus albus]|nr:hypothetical protein Lal_00026454 [Lupinus albus]
MTLELPNEVLFARARSLGCCWWHRDDRDECLKRIKDLTKPKETWDTLTTLLARKSDAKLQQLENELISLTQEDMAISKLDSEGEIYEARKMRIIIFLHLIQDIMNILANHEALDNQMSKVSINEEDKALFRKG